VIDPTCWLSYNYTSEKKKYDIIRIDTEFCPLAACWYEPGNYSYGRMIKMQIWTLPNAKDLLSDNE